MSLTTEAGVAAGHLHATAGADLADSGPLQPAQLCLPVGPPWGTTKCHFISPGE